ncbi:MAG: hypothetical protein KBG15_05280 [Kofleriaceae bacterium]|nr:hypothetical protein [Kofleriaceae bacterium]
MNPHLRLRSWFSFAAVAIAACSSSTIKKDPPQQPGLPPNDTVALKQTVKIAVAAVTLGEDCEGLDTQTASAPVANSMNSVASQSKPLPAGKRAPLPLGDSSRTAGDVPNPGPSQASRLPAHCEQTAIQLQITSAGDATTIALRNVELLDDKGQVLGTLTSRLPTRWDDSASVYTPWDLSVAAGASVKVSWALSTPDWSAFGMTRNEAANRTFRVRVTIGAAGGDQVLDGQARVVVTSPASPLPPGVVT